MGRGPSLLRYFRGEVEPSKHELLFLQLVVDGSSNVAFLSGELSAKGIQCTGRDQ